MIHAFATFAAGVLNERDADGIRGIDSERNRYALHVATAGFASKPLDEIASVDVRDWLRVMSRKQAADSRGERLICADTIKRSFALVSSIFTAAIERDLIKSSPTRDVKVRKRADEASTREKWTTLTLDEQKLIASCAAIPYLDRLAIRFAVATAMRQGEQFNLLLSDLHTGVDSPRVVVRYGSFKKAKGKLPPKSGKIRTVPLFGDGLIAAREWLAELPTFAPKNPLGLAFPYASGSRRGVGKPLGRGPLLREHLRHVGIERRVRWHDLRHTGLTNLATGALGEVWPLLAIKEMAGHSSVTITERYAHVGQRDLVNLRAASAFAHETKPLAACLAAPATERDVSTWFDEAEVA